MVDDSRISTRKLLPTNEAEFDAIARLIELRSLKCPAGIFRLDPLMEILHAVYAPKHLVGFLGVAIRIHKILNSNNSALLLNLTGRQMKRWRKTLRRVIANAHELSLEIFGPDSKQRLQFLAVDNALMLTNPLIGKGIKMHSCYGLIWHVYPDVALDNKFLNLQAVVLGAHISVVQSSLEFEQWIAGTDLDTATSLSIYNACHASRQFIRRYSIYKSVLYSLPYVSNLTDTQEVFSLYFGASGVVGEDLKAIVFLVKWAFETSSHKQRTLRPHKRNRKLAPPPDEVLNSEGKKFSFQKSIVDDEAEVASEITEVNVTENNLQKIDELLAVGDFPGEELTTTDLILVTDKAASRLVRSGWIEARNQLMPGGWDTLAIDEVAYAFRHLEERVVRGVPFSLEVLALVTTIFCTGRALKLVLPLWISRKSVNGDLDGVGLILPNSGAPEWKVRALRPDKADKLPESLPGGREIVGSFALPDVFGGSNVIRQLIESKKIKIDGENVVILFENDPEKYQSMIDSALKEIDPLGRLTLRRIENYLFQRVLDRVRDIATAAYVTQNKHMLASARLFYSSFSVYYLRQVYKMVMIEICDELKTTGFCFPMAVAGTDEVNGGACVGSPLCPTIETVVQAIRKLKMDIQKMFRQEQPDLRELSNLCSFFVYLWFSCEVAARGVKGCYITDDELAALTKQATTIKHILSRIDKSDAAGTHARIYCLSDDLLEQMVIFKVFRDSVSRALFSNMPATPPIYLIDGANVPHAIRPAVLNKLLAKYLPFPANFARHLLRSELIESYILSDGKKGLPPEFVDCLLGHWNLGEEPGGQFSTFPYPKYFAVFESRVANFLKRLGFGKIQMFITNRAGTSG